MSKVHDTAPSVIYLCLGDDDEVLDELFPDLAESGEISWSEDGATTHVVRYVRADALDAAREEIASLLDKWNAVVAASGSPTHGGCVGHVAAMRAALDNSVTST